MATTLIVDMEVAAQSEGPKGCPIGEVYPRVIAISDRECESSV